MPGQRLPAASSMIYKPFGRLLDLPSASKVAPIPLLPPSQVHHALKLSCWINTIERRDFSPPYVDKVCLWACVWLQR